MLPVTVVAEPLALVAYAPSRGRQLQAGSAYAALSAGGGMSHRQSDVAKVTEEICSEVFSHFS